MSTKGKGKSAKAVKESAPPVLPPKVLISGPQKQVFIIDDADKLNDVSSLKCVSIMHPKHGKPSRYLHTNRDLWEVQRVYQPPSSWILNSDIQEDGSFYLCTRIDPLFLLLPFLEKGRKKSADHEGYFLQLDQLVPKSDFPTVLFHSDGQVGSTASIRSVCDVREGWNESVVRLNDDKMLAWLRAKVGRMQQQFKKLDTLKHLYSEQERNEGATEEKKEEATTADTASPPTPASASLKQCLLFLSEYLSPSHFHLLLSSYSLTLDDVTEKKRAAKNWSDGGRISADVDTSRPAGAPTLSETKRKAEKPISASAKKLAAAAKGTRSLASFFGAPKPKA